jgi:hypothetical protein
MTKIYFKILVGLVILLWTIYFLQVYNEYYNKHYNINDKRESFTPKINGMYRPYVRNMNQKYESFINNYGPNVITNKLKKWNIY